MKIILSFIVLVYFCFLITACGQSGGLYLPQKTLNDLPQQNKACGE